MKRILTFVMIVGLCSQTGFATTKTVGKTGADFTSIQAAIDSFTEAELTDGTPDVVEIIDGEEYDEQVMIGHLVPNPDDTTPPGYLDDAIALVLTQDPFTLRGADPNNRPKINPISGDAISYGVFTDDGGDNFIASFSFMGKDVTIENVDIIQSSIIDSGQYGANGQAANMTFRNVLFASSGDPAPGESILNFNNDVSLAGKGIDNTYTFEKCTFDMSVNGEPGVDVDVLYFHGYSQGDADGAGVNVEDVPFRVTFTECNFLNSNGLVSNIRGRAQANHVTFDRCFVSGNKFGLRGSGKGTYTVENSIFYMNASVAGDIDTDTLAIGTTGRDGHTPALTVRNCLIVDTHSADFGLVGGTLGFETRGAAIRVRNDGNDPAVTIENCTFVNNPVAIRFADGSGRPRTASVNNSIFQNCNVAVLTASDQQEDYFNSVGEGSPVESLTVTGSNNIFDGNAVIVENNNLLPNVNLQGSEATVTFNNTTINPDDPFAGPPYEVASGAPTGVGADLGAQTFVSEFMLY